MDKDIGSVVTEDELFYLYEGYVNDKGVCVSRVTHRDYHTDPSREGVVFAYLITKETSKRIAGIRVTEEFSEEKGGYVIIEKGYRSEHFDKSMFDDAVVVNDMVQETTSPIVRKLSRILSLKERYNVEMKVIEVLKENRQKLLETVGKIDRIIEGVE